MFCARGGPSEGRFLGFDVLLKTVLEVGSVVNNPESDGIVGELSQCLQHFEVLGERLGNAGWIVDRHTIEA
jgi:hypothetical protein